MIPVLREIPVAPQTVACWFAVPTARLIEYLSETHERWLRQDLPWIEHLMDCIESAEPSVRALRRVFAKIRHEMEEHLGKEERILFPAVLEMERCSREGRDIPHLPFGSVRNPVTMLEQDHQTEARLWQEL